LPGHKAAGGYELRVAERCLIEDLGFRDRDAERGLADLAAGDTDGAHLLRSFLDKRDASPEAADEDVMNRLATGTPAMYILRRGARQRGLTWFDAEAGIVWLVAAHHAHRSGESDDSYAYFRGLSRADVLPSREDMKAMRTERANEATDAIFDEVPRLMEEAAKTRNVEVRGHVGRVPISMVMTDDAPPHLYLAVSSRWESVGVQPPEMWLFAVLARCYGHEYDGKDHLPLDTKLPTRDRTPDEEIYADFVSDWPRS
jgi:hypothetical protein